MLERARMFSAILRVRARLRMPVLSAICYHSIGEPGPDYPCDDEVIDATRDEFRWQLALLKRHFTVVGPEDVEAMVAGGPTPPNPVIITFDDGYRSCRDVALPLLSEFGLTATFFIATDYVTHRRPFWWDTVSYLVKRSSEARIVVDYPRRAVIDLRDRKAAIARVKRLVSAEFGIDLRRFIAGLARASAVAWTPAIEAELADRLVMTWQDIRALHDAGMEIASHTRSHVLLRNLPADALGDELAGSRGDIEREIQEPVRSLAYPVGYRILHLPRLRAAVQSAGYDIGFTNATGVNYLWRTIDRFDIRRLATARGVSSAMFLGQLALPPLAFTRAV